MPFQIHPHPKTYKDRVIDIIDDILDCEVRIRRLEEAFALKYNPDQPRDDHGRWTSGGSADTASIPNTDTFSGGHEDDTLQGGPKDGAYSTPSGVTYNNKIQRQMAGRGWTPEQIDEAVSDGPRIDAINKAAGGPATRYCNPITNQSVIIDNTTNKIIQVGGPTFRFGEESGDVPGAQFRPSPPKPQGGGGGGGLGKPIDIFHRNPEDDLLE